MAVRRFILLQRFAHNSGHRLRSEDAAPVGEPWRESSPRPQDGTIMGKIQYGSLKAVRAELVEA